MAHWRDHRRMAYFRALSGLLGDDLASAESHEDGDQVLYHPRRVVVAPDPRTGELDRALVERVGERLGTRARSRRDGKGIPGWEDLDVWTFELDPGADGPDSLAIAAELHEAFPQQISPLHYVLTQQHAQPGDDPEAGFALRALTGGARRAALAARRGGQALGDGVRVAVLDTGVDPAAIEAGGLGSAVRFGDADIDALADVSPLASGVVPTVPPLLAPAAGHGTFIAGLVHLVAPGATVLAYGVADPMGFADEERLALGILRAIEDGAHVISLSLGGYAFVENRAWPSLRAFPVLEQAIAKVPRSVAVVAAAGNCGSDAPFYPAAFDRAIAVSALDGRDRLWPQSNFGDWVDACAPGVDLCSVFVRGEENPAYDRDEAERWDGRLNFARWSGTSFAAPLVAAQVAVLAAELGLADDTARAAAHLLNISRQHAASRPCGRRVLVDLPQA